MPKSNVRGGKHHKKGKKKRAVDDSVDHMITYAGVGQVYAFVKRRFGGSRLDVECSDGKMRSALIPGKFFKKIWINAGDILLCELNNTNDDSMCFIIHKYTNKDAAVLKSQGKINFEVVEENEETGYNFEGEGEDEDGPLIEPQRIMPDLNEMYSLDKESDEEEEQEEIDMNQL